MVRDTANTESASCCCGLVDFEHQHHPSSGGTSGGREPSSPVTYTVDPGSGTILLAAGGGLTFRSPQDIYPILCDPIRDLGGIEPHKLADLAVRDSSLAHEAADESGAHGESNGDLADVQELHCTVAGGAR